MNTTLIIATIAITLALIFYTIGVWAERRKGNLQKWHLVTFWAGFAFDSTGTFLMSIIANDSNVISVGLSSSLHAITGLIAIFLMLFHATWASYVMLKNDEIKRKSFHKFSLFVWIAWLIPYFIGMYLGITS